MKTIKKFDIVSVGKILGLIYAALGFIFGGIFTLMTLVMGEKVPGAFFGLAAIIILPIIYGVLGFVSGVIMAFIYNLSSKYSGGIKIELTD